MSVLDKIAEYKRSEVAALKASRPLSDIEREAAAAPPPKGFAQALLKEASSGCAIIAEIKKASPSKGVIREDFEPDRIAASYRAGGAACLSVLTDGPSFQGSGQHLRAASKASALPVLRKDFMLDPYQAAESREMGADCILVIMAMVGDGQASEIEAAARSWGMDVLVEVHDRSELERACRLKSSLIGINNRNLRTFEVSLETTENLAPEVPPDRDVIAESGLKSGGDLARLAKLGVRRFLIGESLMRSGNAESDLQSLIASCHAEEAAA